VNFTRPHLEEEPTEFGFAVLKTSNSLGTPKREAGLVATTCSTHAFYFQLQHLVIELSVVGKNEPASDQPK
jgi:hypothetical protein